MGLGLGLNLGSKGAVAAVSDTEPDAFSFTDETDVTASTLTTSDIIQITGIDDGTAISISGDGSPEYRICADGTCSTDPVWTSSAGAIDNDEYVQLRLTSASGSEATNSATLTIGTESDQWDVTTEQLVEVIETINPNDTGGDAWREQHPTTTTVWTALDGVNAVDYSSGDEDTVSTDNAFGVSQSADLSMCSMGPPTQSRQGHRYKFAVSASESSITQLTPTVKVEVSVTTSPSADNIQLYIWDDTNTQWDIVDEQSSWSANTAYTLTGNITSNISDYIDSNGDAYLMVFLKHTDCAWSLTVNYAELEVTANEPADTTPAAFSFTDQTDVATSTQTESNIIQITGINTGADISISGDGSPEYQICDDSACNTVNHTWSSSAGTISPDEYVQVRLTSSASNEAELSATLDIGGFTDEFSVTTAAPAPTVYNPNDAGNTAWGISNYAGRPPTGLATADIEDEHNGTQLNTISTDDTNGVIGGAQFGGTKIRYALSEAEADITQLDITISVSDNGKGGPGDMSLYIWNFNTTTWDDTGEGVTSSTKSELSHTITTGITDYVDGSGNCYILTQSERGDASHAPTVYYSELQVTS